MSRPSFGVEFFRSLKRLGPYRRPVLLGVISLVWVNAIELLMPELLARVVNELIALTQGVGTTSRSMWSWAGIYFAAATLQSVFRYAWRVWLIRSSILAATDLRIQFFDALKRLKYGFFERHSTGELMSLAVSDTESVRMCLGPGILMAVDALFYLTLVPLALWRIDPQWTLWALGPLVLLPAVVYFHQRRLQQLYESAQARLDQLTATASEMVSHLTMTRVLGAEQTQGDLLKRASAGYRDRAWQLHLWHTFLSPALEMALSVGIVASLYLGTRALTAGEGSVDPVALNVGAFVAFQRYLQKLIWPISAVGYVLNLAQRGVISERRLSTVLNADVESDEASATSPRDVSPAHSGAETPWALEIKDLRFSYPGARPGSPPIEVLRGVNLQVRKGERMALLGAIGAGKSTLLLLITRVYDPPRGTIFVEGRDVLDWSLRELRQRWAVLVQDAFLFAPHIQANLMWNENQKNHREEHKSSHPSQAVHALNFAELSEELTLEHPVHPGGRNLSGGQRQRAAIARGWMQQASGWLIDDALSAVDPVREGRILERWTSARTTLIYVTHRETALDGMDHVYELKEGKIVEVTERYRAPQETPRPDAPISVAVDSTGDPCHRTVGMGSLGDT